MPNSDEFRTSLVAPLLPPRQTRGEVRLVCIPESVPFGAAVRGWRPGPEPPVWDDAEWVEPSGGRIYTRAGDLAEPAVLPFFEFAGLCPRTAYPAYLASPEWLDRSASGAGPLPEGWAPAEPAEVEFGARAVERAALRFARLWSGPDPDGGAVRFAEEFGSVFTGRPVWVEPVALVLAHSLLFDAFRRLVGLVGGAAPETDARGVADAMREIWEAELPRAEGCALAEAMTRGAEGWPPFRWRELLGAFVARRAAPLLRVEPDVGRVGLAVRPTCLLGAFYGGVLFDAFDGRIRRRCPAPGCPNYLTVDGTPDGDPLREDARTCRDERCRKWCQRHGGGPVRRRRDGGG